MIFYFFYLIVILIVGLTSYIVTNSVIYCIIACLVFIFYFLVFEFLIKKKIVTIKRKKEDQAIFLNDFLSVYCVENNIDKSIQYASFRVSSELKEELKLLEEYKGIDKLNNLSNYFSNKLYDLFLSTIKSKDQNCIEFLQYIKRENDFTYKIHSEFNKGIKKVILEYLILWLAASLILVSMRFAIHNYFNKISTSIFYLIGVSMFYLVFILSIHLLIRSCVKKYE